MRIFLLAGVALLAACGGGSETNTTDANAMATDNMMMDANVMMDPNMMMDPAMNGAMDANGAVDANTQEMMLKDATSNDADTNLANGL